MVSTRHADDADNQELLALEKMCPQGTSLVLQFDRSPDFFLRSRVYDNYNVYVAEEEGTVVGTVGATLKEFNMGGDKVKGIYIYDLRVHPAFRGKGIGSKLVQQVLADETEADLSYGHIMEENYPSIALFKRLGFQKIHDFVSLNVPLYKRQEQIAAGAGEMTADDVPGVVDLMNNYYSNQDFYSTLSVDKFLNRTKKLTEYGFQGMQIVKVNNQIVACAGLWDYSKIFRASVLRVTARLKMLRHILNFANFFTDTVKLPSIGEFFRVMFVTDFAFTGEGDCVRKLVEHCLRLSYGCGCNFLAFPLDPLDSAVPLIAKYRPIKTSYGIYARSLKEEELGTQKMIYVDTIDL